jgi:hypothetical protein
MTVEALSQESNGQHIHHRFLYADYSHFDDNINVIEMLKEFVSVSGKLLRLNSDNERMISLMNNAASLSQEVMKVLNQVSTNTGEAIDGFYKKYPNALATELHTSSAALLNDARKNILTFVANTETGVSEQHGKYKDSLGSRIKDNHAAAGALLESWLSRDYKNFPTPFLSSLAVEIMIDVDLCNSKVYNVRRSSKIIKQVVKNANQIPVNYAFHIDTSEIGFWASIRKISEFELKDVELPIGMKAPLSERLKNALKLGSRKSENVLEPEFVKIDDYCILSIKLNVKTLVVQVAPDVSKADIDFIEITYYLHELETWRSAQLNYEPLGSGHHPKINYKSRNNRQTVEFMDSLSVKEIAQAANLTKIMSLGTSILEKLDTLRDPKVISSRSKLDLLKVGEQDVILLDGEMKVEFSSLFELLNLIAKSFAPFVKRLKEKSPVHGELILREVMEDGQRTEFMVKLEYLRSQLLSSNYFGRELNDILQL